MVLGGGFWPDPKFWRFCIFLFFLEFFNVFSCNFKECLVFSVFSIFQESVAFIMLLNNPAHKVF